MDRQTLDELDPPAWADAADDDTYLVRRCRELRVKPLGQFTTEDLRIMIAQKIALPHLVPRALKNLAANPLTSGDLFPGDLLETVMRIDDSYWTEHPDQLVAIKNLAGKLLPVDEQVRAAVEAFRARHA